MILSSELLRDKLLSIMKSNGVTYRELGARLGTSPQNVYKRLHKEVLSLSDVTGTSNALGYNIDVSLIPIEKSHVNVTLCRNRTSSKIKDDLVKVQKDLANIIESIGRVS